MALTLKETIKAATIAAMRDKAKDRLTTIRLISAEIKQQEVDKRIELDDSAIIAILDKMLAKRKDAKEQFAKAGRDDLASKEEFEITVLQEFLPPQLSEAEVTEMVNSVIQKVKAESIRDMGKVMAELKPLIQGRADMALVSKYIKDKLSSD